MTHVCLCNVQHASYRLKPPKCYNTRTCIYNYFYMLYNKKKMFILATSCRLRGYRCSNFGSVRRNQNQRSITEGQKTKRAVLDAQASPPPPPASKKYFPSRWQLDVQRPAISFIRWLVVEAALESCGHHG